jgi:hypothetical protein
MAALLGFAAACGVEMSVEIFLLQLNFGDFLETRGCMMISQ